MRLLFGFIFGLFLMSHWTTEAFAFGFKAVSTGERIGAVLFGVILLVLVLYFVRHFFNRAFFHGFLAAIGMFFTVDNILFHWIFQLHRMTNGPEANILEPLFVLIGIFLVIYAVKKERPS